MSHILDTEHFTTASGRTYRVDFVQDDNTAMPYENGDYMYPSIAAPDRGARNTGLRLEPGQHALDLCTHVIDPQRVCDALEGTGDYWHHEISPRAVARWLRLQGATAISEFSMSGYDGSVSVTPWNFDARDASRIDGLAWYNPGLTDAEFSDGDDNDARMADEIAVYNAWRTGDTFGYRTLEVDADDNEIGEVADGSVWGFYGLDREREYVLSEAKDNAEQEEQIEATEAREAAERAALAAQQAAERLESAKADARDGLELLAIWKRENVIGARAIWDGHVRAELSAGHALLALGRKAHA